MLTFSFVRSLLGCFYVYGRSMVVGLVLCYTISCNTISKYGMGKEGRAADFSDSEDQQATKKRAPSSSDASDQSIINELYKAIGNSKIEEASKLYKQTTEADRAKWINGTDTLPPLLHIVIHYLGYCHQLNVEEKEKQIAYELIVDLIKDQSVDLNKVYLGETPIELLLSINECRELVKCLLEQFDFKFDPALVKRLIDQAYFKKHPALVTHFLDQFYSERDKNLWDDQELETFQKFLLEMENIHYCEILEFAVKKRYLRIVTYLLSQPRCIDMFNEHSVMCSIRGLPNICPTLGKVICTAILSTNMKSEEKYEMVKVLVESNIIPVNELTMCENIDFRLNELTMCGNIDFRPLDLAAKYNYDKILRCLLGYERIEPNKASQSILGMYLSPLFRFIVEGDPTNKDYKPTIDIFLASNKVNVNRQDGNGNPIHFIAYLGTHGMLKTVVDLPDINLNATGRNSCTPLHYAAMSFSLSKVQILLDKSDVSINSKNEFGHTPFDLVLGCLQETESKEDEISDEQLKILKEFLNLNVDRFNVSNKEKMLDILNNSNMNNESKINDITALYTIPNADEIQRSVNRSRFS